ncbi:rust resistance kinase Lr10 [Trifolium repens]|nr:rust resistance kinase Lr10 [Trifolium repens]
MVGGRKNVDSSSAENSHVLYPECIHNLLEGDIHIHIDDEGDVKIAKKLAIVGLWCIQWQPMNRLMDNSVSVRISQVIRELLYPQQGLIKSQQWLN